MLARCCTKYLVAKEGFSGSCGDLFDSFCTTNGHPVIQLQSYSKRLWIEAKNVAKLIAYRHVLPAFIEERVLCKSSASKGWYELTIILGYSSTSKTTWLQLLALAVIHDKVDKEWCVTLKWEVLDNTATDMPRICLQTVTALDRWTRPD